MSRPTECFDKPCPNRPTKWVISDSNGLRIQMAMCEEHAAPFIKKAAEQDASQFEQPGGAW